MKLGVSTTTGIVYTFCDSTCLKRYKRECKPPWKSGEVIDTQIAQLKGPPCCLYCRDCGLLVFETNNCVIHEMDDCPGYSWERSLQAHTFAVHFLLRTGRRRVPDYLLEQAKELSLLHPCEPGAFIAAAVIDGL